MSVFFLGNSDFLGQQNFKWALRRGGGRRADLIVSLTLRGAKVNRPLYGCEGMLGNQDNLVGIQKFVWEFNFKLILPNSIYIHHFLFANFN